MNDIVKPGYLTTEFWLTAIAVLLGVLVTSGILEPLGTEHWAVKVVALLISALAAMGYSHSRATVKKI